MKKICIVFFVVFSSLHLQAQDSATRKAITNIELRNREMETAFNKNDMQAVAGFYTDDAEITAENYNVKGRKNIDNYWMNLKDKGRGWKLSITEIGGQGEYLYQLGTSDLTYINRGTEHRAVTNFVLVWKLGADKVYRIFRDYLTSVKFEK